MTLSEHWRDVLTRQGVDCTLVLCEWNLLKQLLYSNDDIYSITWQQINAKYRQRTPNILDLIDLVLSLPASSAECERGFSVMKLTKTDYRNRLSSKTMTEIMRIKLHSPSIEDFDPAPAIHIWNKISSIRSRRPAFKSSKHTQLSEAVFDSVADVASTSTSNEPVTPNADDDDESDYESCDSDFSVSEEDEGCDLFEIANNVDE
ncbi:uncharacterized protein [Ptychodera flava]|uniref:uncharacterized protein n=1 Tax=Ptychodera flava TaxID=63121 RepID=UPI003969E423